MGKERIYTGMEKDWPLLNPKKKDSREELAYNKDGIFVSPESENAVTRFWLPPQPDIQTIYGYGLPKKDQVWRIPPEPKNIAQWAAEELDAQERGDYSVINKEYEEYKRQEWERRVNGFWFMLEGEPTYITGKHYFYLTSCKLDVGYPDFYWELIEHYLWLETLIEKERTYGYMWIGGRGIGKSSVEVSTLLEEMTRPPHNTNAGIQSKTEKDARSILTKKLVPMFNQLPPYFKPNFENTSQAKSELSFYRLAKRGKFAKTVNYDATEELGNKITFYDSQVKSADGETFRWFFEDEIGKTDPNRADVYERNSTNIRCVNRNVGKIGMLGKTSTVEEMDDGGAECKKLWIASDPSKINKETGETISGLERRFVSILHSDSRFRNRYGKVNYEEAKKYHDANRAQLANRPSDLASYIRKNPYSAEEAFYANADKCPFDVMVLQSTLAKLHNIEQLRGDLVWVNGERFSKVAWVPNPSGGFLASSWLPPENELNRVTTSHNGIKRVFAPEGVLRFYIGLDPVDHGEEGTKNRKSTPVALCKSRFDANIDPSDLKPEESRLYPYESNKYFLLYDKRMDDPNDFYENMVKLCWWLGSKVMVETNKKGIVNYFKDHGMEKFLHKRPVATFNTNTKKAIRPDGVPSHVGVIQQYTELIAIYVAYFGHTIEFTELLDDLLEFDPKNTRKYDYAVAMGFTELAQLGATERKDYSATTLKELFGEVYGHN